MYEAIEQYVLKMVSESTPEYTVWNMERIRDGKPANWNYVDGCMLTALLSMAEITGDSTYFQFVEKMLDHFVNEDGSIKTLALDKHSLDDINEGRVLFEVFRRTGKPKYQKAIELLKKQLDVQPRTAEGSFWHKQIYPNQVWLDGVYMAQPFRALYQVYSGGND